MPPAPLPSNLRSFVEKPRHAVVGTSRDDGTPVTTPCWYGIDDQDRVILSMGHDSHRLRHIRANPKVALTVLGDDWYSHVSVIGRAVDFRSDDDLADIDALSQRYEGVPYEDREYEGMTVFVEIDRWHTWGDPSSEA